MNVIGRQSVLIVTENLREQTITTNEMSVINVVVAGAGARRKMIRIDVVIETTVGSAKKSELPHVFAFSTHTPQA